MIEDDIAGFVYKDGSVMMMPLRCVPQPQNLALFTIQREVKEYHIVQAQDITDTIQETMRGVGELINSNLQNVYQIFNSL